MLSKTRLKIKWARRNKIEIPRRKHAYSALIVFLAVAGILFFSSANKDKLGFYHDDGIYLVTAKALATGQGYKILSLPDEAWQTKYPPVFPMALSMLWRMNSAFPDNLSWFFAFSILCTLIFLTLIAAHLMKNSFASPIQVWMVMIFTAINWRMIVLATSVLSEMLYAALSLGVLYIASSMEERRIGVRSLGLGMLLALALLTRLAGISLLAAILLYAFRRGQIRRYLLPIIMASLLVAGWFLWCNLHQTSSISSQTTIYTDYFTDWRALIQSDNSGSTDSFWGSVFLMAAKNAARMLAAVPVVCLGFQINSLQNMVFAWRLPAILIGLLFLVFLILGFCKSQSPSKGLIRYYIVIYVSLHLCWPYTIYDRILIPILPFLLLFFLSGGAALLHRCLQSYPNQSRAAKTVGMFFFATVTASFLAASVLGFTTGFRDQILHPRSVYAAEAQERRELVDWLKANVRSDDILACYQDPIYFLFTGIKAVRLPTPAPDEATALYASRFQSFVEENKVTLLLQTINDFSLESYSGARRIKLYDAIKYRHSFFAPVYFSHNRNGTVYRIRSESAD